MLGEVHENGQVFPWGADFLVGQLLAEAVADLSVDGGAVLEVAEHESITVTCSDCRVGKVPPVIGGRCSVRVCLRMVAWARDSFFAV